MFQQSMYHRSLSVQLYVHFRPVSIITRDMVALANPPTSSWDEDLMYSVQINCWLLKPIGVWPISLCVTTREKISSIMLALISSFLISFLLVPCALCTILDETGDLDTKIKMIGPLSFCVMAAIKYYILVSRGAKIGKCVEDIGADWYRAHSQQSIEDRRIMRENARIGRFLATFCAGFMYSGGFFYTTVMPLCSKHTEIIDNETVRSQAFPIYRGLLDPRTSPSFEIVQLMQCLSGFVLYSVTVGACSLTAVFVMHACGQFEILVTRIQRLVDGLEREKDLDSGKERLGEIVEYHLYILGFISQIEELLNEICFVEVVGCTMNICFLGYYLLTVKKLAPRDVLIHQNSICHISLSEWEQNEALGTLTYCTFLISLTFNIFILCYIGEILSEQCKSISLSAYMIDWYRLPRRKALGLILIFAISNNSTKLRAGKLIELSLGSFCS
ncbi:unnamed protein product, partial [Heterotrigona itama]